MTDIERLLTERGKTHGDYKDHAGITQMLKQVMRQGKKWPLLHTTEAETLDMIAHKIGRILSGNPHFKDHWDDIAGYAQLVAKECK